MTPLEQGAVVIIALALATAGLVLWLEVWTRHRIRDLRSEFAGLMEEESAPARRAYARAAGAADDFAELRAAFAELGDWTPEQLAALEQARQRVLRQIDDEFEAVAGVPLAAFEASLAAANLPRGYRDDETFLSDLGISPD